MDGNALVQFKDIGIAGAALAFSAIGSAAGTGVAGMAAIGAWKKCFAQNKTAPFIFLSFVGAPLTQTIYGMIVMNALIEASKTVQNLGILSALGMLSGAAIGFSAWFQGKAAASASDAMGETGKGFGNYLMVLGIIETVAIFTMVFTLMAIGKVQ